MAKIKKKQHAPHSKSVQYEMSLQWVWNERTYFVSHENRHWNEYKYDRILQLTNNKINAAPESWNVLDTTKKYNDNLKHVNSIEMFVLQLYNHLRMVTNWPEARPRILDACRTRCMKFPEQRIWAHNSKLKNYSFWVVSLFWFRKKKFYRFTSAYFDCF